MKAWLKKRREKKLLQKFSVRSLSHILLLVAQNGERESTFARASGLLWSRLQAFATEPGSVGLVRYLVKIGANVNYADEDGRTPLLCAADSGNLDVVRELVDRGAAVDTQDNSGRTPLWRAADSGNLDVVRELIDRGAAVDTKDNDGSTPLWRAADSGNLDVVRELANRGAAVDTEDNSGRTPLWRAADSGNLDVVRELIDRGAAVDTKANGGSTPLSHAAWSGRFDVVRELIDRGAAVDTQDNGGRTPLWRAAWSGHLDMVRELIDRGAAVDTQDNGGRTPLWRAAWSGHLDMVRELIDRGAAVDTQDNDGSTPLWHAADSGNLDVVRELIDRGAAVDTQDNSGRTPLWRAADSGNLDVVRELIDRGAAVDTKDNDGSTPLWRAADSGNLDVVRELIDRGAAVDTKANDGSTPLSHAAWNGRLDVVRELIDRGAAVDTQDNDGSTPLSHAAWNGRFDVVRELIDRGAAVDTQDNGGRTPLSHAAWSGHLDVVRELIDRGAAVDTKDNDGRTSLSYVAARGHVQVAKELIAIGALVDAASFQGRTLLFYAAEHGHMDMVQLLLKAGVCLWTKAHSSQPRRESETALLLAGRAGHMNIFQFFINAGAPVNVRSGEDGETPLISAARSDFFAGVQLLIARGGCLREDEVTEDEYPLIPGTLKTMRSFCDAAHEFEPMCSCILIRLDGICSKLQEAHVTRAKEGTLVSFASTLFRFCRLQIDIGKRESPLLRFIGSRAIANRIRDFHEELDHFVGMLALEQNENRWKEQWDDDQTQLLVRFDEKLSTDEVFINGFDSEATRQETAVLLLYELKISRQEKQRPELQASLERVVERFLRVCNMDAPVIPEWFISRDDVEFQSWNLVGSEGEQDTPGIQYYEGKWRKTAVIIETCPDASTFEQSATQWHQLNHPNVVKLFGACHIGSPPFFIYELETQGVQLQGFLNKDVNRPLVWKCLYEAALGLRYLHSRGVAHGFLQSKSFTVGSGITKLNGTRQIGIQRSGGYVTSTDAWLPPEASDLFPTASSDIDFSHSEAYDIYAFGICIWEALTRELPWQDSAYYKMLGDKLSGRLPDRPASIGDSERDLITKMGAVKPSERVKMNYVVNRLSKFVITRDQVSEVTRQKPLPSTEIEDKTIDSHRFAALDGDTIPTTLQYIKSRCEKLEGHLWMSDNVYPVLEYIFALLRERRKTPVDTDVLQFCASLSRFQRYLRTAVSKKSVYELARSRHVAEVHHVVYAELDRLLDALDVSEADPIRVWRHSAGKLDENRQEGGLKDATPKSLLEKANTNSSAVTLTQFDTPSATHNLWTRAGLARSPTTPGWFLSLRDLVFSKSDEIGRGSFGTVYKGSWQDTPIVIKFMGYEEDFDTIPTELLVHEVRVWHRLNHPHVLKMYGACHVDKRYFVCEFASNGELRKYLKKPDNEHLMWQKLYEAALGLEYMHGQNIVHNDLKCDNIMVGIGGKAKLIDFGLSCLLNEAEIQIDVTKMGAVNWRSPEYLSGGRPSFASDVYSFAMCIVEVVSGEIPWGRPMSAALVRFQLKRGNIPNLPDSVNEKQRHLIKSMIKFNPAERVNMRFVVDKLNEVAQDEKLMRAL